MAILAMCEAEDRRMVGSMTFTNVFLGVGATFGLVALIVLVVGMVAVAMIDGSGSDLVR